LKEKAGSDLVEVGIAHLIEDEKSWHPQLIETLAEAIHLDVVGELVEQFGDGDEVNVMTVRHRLHAERDGEMCLAHPGWSEQDDVLAVSEKAQGRQFLDLLAVDGGLKAEVEVGERLMKGKVCESSLGDETALGSTAGLRLKESVEEVDITQLSGSPLTGPDFVSFLAYVRVQLEEIDAS
jgi:hypothetical protein